MKQFIKNNLKFIFGFILGIILISTSIYAATNLISSSEVSYTKTDGTTTTVETVLNDLYTALNNITNNSLEDIDLSNSVTVNYTDVFNAEENSLYLAFQISYHSASSDSSVFGTFNGATILSENIIANLSSTKSRICIIKANSSNINAFQESTGNQNYSKTNYIKIN